MIDHVVVDVEIQKTIEETPGGLDATDKLGVSVACVWEYVGQRMRIYGPDDLPALRDRLLKAERISGFNIWRFDFPVIWGISRAEWDRWSDDMTGNPAANLQKSLRFRCDDLLRRIWQALGIDLGVFDKQAHGGWGLDAVTRATLGVGKIGHGAEAPKWFQAGQWARVCNYCSDDVALERDLCDFIDNYGYASNGAKCVKIPPWQGGN